MAHPREDIIHIAFCDDRPIVVQEIHNAEVKEAVYLIVRYIF